ncbi:MAG: ATP-binding protein [Candidatus Dormibacteraeota bacterium]|nr:ATP-binding protein [Candidatus Dormibacteraeota bacterium]
MQLGPRPGVAERVLAALDQLIVVDTEGRVGHVTEPVARVLGHSRERMLGADIVGFVPDSEAAEGLDMVTLGGTERVDGVIRAADGDRVAITLTRIRDREGALLGTAGLMRRLDSWMDPKTGAESRRRWHRTLGALVRTLVELAGGDLAAVDDPATVGSLAVGEARRLVPNAECLLFAPPGEGLDVRVAAGAGPWAGSLVGRDLPFRGSLVEVAVNRRRPLETTRLDGLGEAAAGGAVGMTSVRLVPLLDDAGGEAGGCLGVLGFYRADRAYFRPIERRLMGEFARLLGAALLRTQLRQREAETARRLQLGADAATELTRSLEPDDVADRLLRRAAGAVAADRAVLVRPEGSEAVVVASWGARGHPTPVGLRLPMTAIRAGGEEVALAAMRDGRPRRHTRFENPGLGGPIAADLASVRHSITVPLSLGGETYSLLLLSRRDEPPFGAEDEPTLQLLGSLAELALRNARLFALAQTVSASRSDFLNMAAHELRTPLTAIAGHISMLRDGSFGPVEDAWRRPLTLLAGKADELGVLVDDLLLASQIESGRLPARVSRLDLRAAAAAAVRRAEVRLEMVGGAMGLEPSAAPVPVRADPDHVGRVLDNLINNALSYRRPGHPPEVRVIVRSENDWAVVEVIDHGPGVPPEARERIFQRFVRGEGAGAPAGTGLGLYISRQLAARHGGRVDLELSSAKAGSRFGFRLPLAAGK